MCELVDLLMVLVVAWASVFEGRKDFTIIYIITTTTTLLFSSRHRGIVSDIECKRIGYKELVLRCDFDNAQTRTL